LAEPKQLTTCKKKRRFILRINNQSENLRPNWQKKSQHLTSLWKIRNTQQRIQNGRGWRISNN